MLKRTLYSALVCAMLAIPLSGPAFSATDEERKFEAEQEVIALLGRFGATADPATLQKIDGQVQRSWERFTTYHGYKHGSTSELALLRARSASAAKHKKRVSAAWKDALQLLPINASPATRLNYYTEAAQAAGTVEDFKAAEQFFAAARAYAAIAHKNNADKARLYIRLQELRTVAQGMDWRRLNDSLLDMRKFSQGFVMWSLPRLDALVGEAELRLAYQPHDDEDKRAVLGELKAEIILIQKGLNGTVPPAYVERIRNLFYALEDYLDL